MSVNSVLALHNVHIQLCWSMEVCIDLLRAILPLYIVTFLASSTASFVRFLFLLLLLHELHQVISLNPVGANNVAREKCAKTQFTEQCR